MVKRNKGLPRYRIWQRLEGSEILSTNPVDRARMWVLSLTSKT